MKENDMERQKLAYSELMDNANRKGQEVADLRAVVDSLKHTNSTLQEDIRTFQDVISEQKVSKRRSLMIF